MQRELHVAIAAAKAAGDKIAEIQKSAEWSVLQKEGGKGPLTEADLAANDILISIISAAFPGDAILSEETTDDLTRVNNPRCWIIDPLDGTREFMLSIPEFCVSVGFVLNGEAVVGALYNPATGELIAGALGLGTTYNGRPVSVTKHAELKGARFLVSRSEYQKGWFDDYDNSINLTPMGSVAWKLGLVAAGKAEATFTPKPRNEWDLCAGVACLKAAGGFATDGKAVSYIFNQFDPLKIGVCGSNGVIHDLVMGLIN